MRERERESKTNHFPPVEFIVEKMAGKGGKGLLVGKTTAAAVAAKEKDKRMPVSSSSRASLQASQFWC
ncbi:unnamed protein product [Camellia sinensis]